MKSKNENIIPAPEELGIPSGSSDPLKTIEMEGDLYRGLIKDKKRPFIIRIISIIMGAFIMLPFPIFFGIILYVDPPQGDEKIAAIYIVFMGILFSIIGFKIIKSNLNSGKK